MNQMGNPRKTNRQGDEAARWWADILMRLTLNLRDHLKLEPEAEKSNDSTREMDAITCMGVLHARGMGLVAQRTGAHSARLYIRANLDRARTGEEVVMNVEQDPANNTYQWHSTIENLRTNPRDYGMKPTQRRPDQIQRTVNTAQWLAWATLKITDQAGPLTAWSRASHLFSNPLRTQACALRLQRAVETIENWVRADHALGINGLNRALATHHADLELFYEGDGVERLAEVALTVPADTPGDNTKAFTRLGPGHMNVPMRRAAQQPATIEAWIRGSKKNPQWILGAFQNTLGQAHGHMALTMLANQHIRKMPQERVVQALEAVGKHPEAADPASIRKANECDNPGSPTITRINWLNGKGPWSKEPSLQTE